MRFLKSSSTAALLVCAALSLSASFGQSLSLVKQADSNYWTVHATMPAGSGYSLQGSPNLHLWADLQDTVQDEYSMSVDPSDAQTRFFRMAPSTSAPPIRVLIIGDSMASDCCGWGQGMYGFFKENATVVNYAQPWEGTRVFIGSAEWDKMMLIKPDYVFMQFGFIDSGTDPDRYTTLDEFRANLKTIVEAIRSFNGVPIMVTLHAQRYFDANGKVVPGWQDRNDITKAVSAEENTPLVDLYQLTTDLFNKLGPDGSAFMEYEPGDVMHFSHLGGIYVSQLVVNAAPDALGPYMKDIFGPLPKP
jgi:lysophospholipase L1-like esterase